MAKGKTLDLSAYDPNGFYDELFGAPGHDAPHSEELRRRLAEFSIEELEARSDDADRELYNFGITFTVYSDRQAIDRILPFDVIPRVLSPGDWQTIESGSEQRVAALNLFLHDIYHDRKIIKDGVIPEDLVLGNKNYRKRMEGFTPPLGTYVHICGIDIIRGTDGGFMVLEDNARSPSGVSYVIENRHMMLRTFPELMSGIGIRPVSDYGMKLAAALAEVAPEGVDRPNIALLSPGTYNSAYFEHIFLAREMGVTLVEGSDLFVENDKVYMRTTRGPVPLHVIYRRIDDDFLDPEAFNPDSLLGVPGLFEAYRKGNVTLANAIGTGVADDKAIYAYMPRIIKYYLDQEAILPNVDTRICREPEGLQYTLDNLEKLVVKPVGESGGYGMLVGPHATAEEVEDMRTKLKADPSNYISQPMIGLSVSPTLTEDAIEPRHVDLRPFVITGSKPWVLPGGLTRVALRKGSLVVNSSQGGGSKDTWVLQ